MSRYIALVPAAGTGSRMGTEIPKQYGLLAGKPMIHHAIGALCSCSRIERVYVVLSPSDAHWDGYDWSEFGERLYPLKVGGETRALSVMNGLKEIDADSRDWVLVHDAARPCIDPDSLSRLMDEVSGEDVGGLLALPVADTLKREDGRGRVLETVPRSHLWQAQTPQMFRHGMLQDALSKAPKEQTDEAGAVEALGFFPRLFQGSPSNFKVTWPQDREIAELILASRRC